MIKVVVKIWFLNLIEFRKIGKTSTDTLKELDYIENVSSFEIFFVYNMALLYYMTYVYKLRLFPKIIN